MISKEDHLKRISGLSSMTYIADNFGKYAIDIELSRYLCRYELFKKILNIKGSIIECGVKSGSGLMQWYRLSTFLEPRANFRTVYGFDTFCGFPAVGEFDTNAKIGEMADNSYEDLITILEISSRRDLVCLENGEAVLRYPWPRVELIKGDFLETHAGFLESHKHLVISLLFLDFDLYEPTKKALQVFRDRMPKGAIIAFDELNNLRWPGETLALMETLGIPNHRIEKFPFDMNIAYIEL